jgi:hypothetical protein
MQGELIRAQWRRNPATGRAGFLPIGTASAGWCQRLEDREAVVLEVRRGRSERSHRHAFAFIDEAWRSLPEDCQGMPWAASPTTLRKWALISTGHCDCTTVDAGTKASAERVAAVMSTLANQAHGFAVVAVRGTSVTVWTPHSMEVRRMGGEAFQQAKQDVLEHLAALLEVEAAELEAAAAC